MSEALVNFLQQLVNGLQLGSIYALIALGYTMVYGIIRLINFAHGDVYMVGAFIGFFVAGWLGETALIPALLLAMIGAALLGVTIERLAYRPLRSAPRLAALTTAIGISLLLENLVRLYVGPNFLAYPEMIKRVNHYFGGVLISNVYMIVFGTAIVLMAGLQYIVVKTKAGKAMRAVAFDKDAARLMGINVDGVISLTFALGSALAAAAGILVGITYGRIDPYMGIIPGLKAFVAAVIGGIGSIPGAMVGGLVMGVAEQMVIGYISSNLRDAVAFFLLIIILLIKPTGLFAEFTQEKV